MGENTLGYPEATTPSADVYLETSRSVGNRVIKLRQKPEDLTVRYTGDSTETKLSAWMALVNGITGTTAPTAGTVTASKAVVVDANKDITGFRHVTITGNFVTGSTTLSEAELGVLDAVTAGTVAASKALVVDANSDLATLRNLSLSGWLKSTLNAGTANTGTTAVEYGDGYNHVTVLTVNTTLPAIAGGADLGVGKLLYTLPAGAQVIDAAYMSLGITQTEGNINADTPDGGLGTVIASGAVATLDGTATFENILTGQTFNNCTGTAEVKTAIPTAGTSLVMEVGGAKTVYFNVADGWAASGDAAALLAGTVVLAWRTLA